MSTYTAPGLCHLDSEEIARRTQPAAVPKKTAKNAGLITATLMDCMAAIPCAGEKRASAFITDAEKAKNTPPISPQPSPDANVRMEINLSIIYWVYLTRPRRRDPDGSTASP